ncbi:MAG: FHA domain-containing protein [Chloroflexota bacterium]
MKHPPVITVQLVHISGPLKGQIQEFNEDTIVIGRQSTCQVSFPPDLAVVSRKHASIVRDGNQFRLSDHSTNGTFVNGKRITETFLKDGDVLAFSESGPKVSFLTQMKEIPVEALARDPHPLDVLQEAPRERPKPEPAPPVIEKPRAAAPEVVKPAPPAVEVIKAHFTIQYGPVIRSFKEMPVIIGTSPKCHFVLDHPAVCEQHAQVFFSEQKYWLKDLTGQHLLRINQQPIALQAALSPNDEVAMSPQGPFFRYLGEGRLAESEPPVAAQPQFPSAHVTRTPDKPEAGGFVAKLKKIISPEKS